MLACSLALVLAACGGGGQDTSPEAESAAATEALATENSAPLAMTDSGTNAGQNAAGSQDGLPLASPSTPSGAALDNTAESETEPTPAAATRPPAEQSPEPKPESTPDLEPAPEPEAAPAPEPAPEPVPEPTPAPAPAPAASPAADNAAATDDEATEDETPFRVFNAMLYSNMPATGDRPAVVYEHAYYPGGQQQTDGRPTAFGIQYGAQVARDQYHHPVIPATDELVIVDVERWHVWPWVSGQAHRENVEKYNYVMEQTRLALGQPACLYSIAPNAGILHANWSVTDPQIRSDWTTHSDITSEVLLSNIDAFCPALYTYYGGDTPQALAQAIAQWQVYARETIAEARRMDADKPVYVFLWPQYHSGGIYDDFRYLEDDYWRAQLELVKELADGVILWGGWNFNTNRQQAFNANASWWRIYQEVIPADLR